MRLINQLHNMLAGAFPEFAVVVKNISSKSILKLLLKYPTAERMAKARLDSIAKLPHIKPELARQLHEAAKSSTASNRNSISESLIQQKVEAILVEIKVHQELEKIVGYAVKALPGGAHRRVRSIPGVGPQTEAALIAKIVSIDRFSSAKALIGYFGIFPEEVDVSGTLKDGTPKAGKAMRMSRKGNDLVRRLLYTAAQCAVTAWPSYCDKCLRFGSKIVTLIHYGKFVTPRRVTNRVNPPKRATCQRKKTSRATARQKVRIEKWSPRRAP